MLITKALLVSLTAISLALPAASLTIDNFEEGDFNVVDQSTTFGATFAEVSGLQTANVIGGVRLVRAQVAGVPSGVATATTVLITTPAPDDSASMAYLGNGGSGAFSYIYDGNPNGVDDGIAGALGLDLSAFSDLQIDAVTAQAGVLVQVQLSSSTQQQSSSQVVLANGATLIPLGAFNLLDLSDISAIRVNLLGVDTTDVSLIGNIAAVPVPEPGTALLLAAGLAGLAVRSRRS